MPVLDQVDRRPIPVRNSPWSGKLAAMLVSAGCTPNQVSVASVLFAGLGGLFLVMSAWSGIPAAAVCLLAAAVCIEIRLLCNLLDGMMAVEGGLGTSTGAMFNEFPDRISDTIFLVAAGYAARGGSVAVDIGLAAAMMAVVTAYVRMFGACQGLKQDFSGPMAKQHRMHLLAIALVAGAAELYRRGQASVILAALGLIVAGAAWTSVRRATRIARALETRR